MFLRLIVPALSLICLSAASEHGGGGGGAPPAKIDEVAELRRQLAEAQTAGAAKDEAALKKIAALEKRLKAVEQDAQGDGDPKTLTEGIARIKAEQRGIDGMDARAAAQKRWPNLRKSAAAPAKPATKSAR